MHTIILTNKDGDVLASWIVNATDIIQQINHMVESIYVLCDDCLEYFPEKDCTVDNNDCFHCGCTCR